MSDPSVEIQNAVEAALRASAAVKSAMGLATVRLYTLSAPVNAPFPHLIIGEDQIVGDDSDCGQASDVAVTIHVYSRTDTPAATRLQAKAIAAAVRQVLTAELTVTGHRVIDWQFETTRHLKDPDGLTAHSVVTLEYHTAPSA
jgi:hypothetical protein